MTDLFGAVQDPPWGENPPPVVAPEIEEWARALCVADGGNPDKLFGFPAWPRWHAYTTYAALAITAQKIVAAAHLSTAAGGGASAPLPGAFQ